MVELVHLQPQALKVFNKCQAWPEYYNIYYQQHAGGGIVGREFPWVFPWESPHSTKNKGKTIVFVKVKAKFKNPFPSFHLLYLYL